MNQLLVLKGIGMLDNRIDCNTVEHMNRRADIRCRIHSPDHVYQS